MIRSLMAILCLTITVQVHADVKCPLGTQFKESLSIIDDFDSEIKVVLNGVGVKKIFFFNVFYGALYLEEKSQDADFILNSSQLKVGHIHTLRSVGKSQLASMWDNEFKRLCGDMCGELLPFHKQFLSFSRDFEKSENLYLLMFEDHFEFEVNGDEFYDPIMSPEYGKLLLRGLFGPDASDKKLEKGLLGKEVICKKI